MCLVIDKEMHRFDGDINAITTTRLLLVWKALRVENDGLVAWILRQPKEYFAPMRGKRWHLNKHCIEPKLGVDFERITVERGLHAFICGSELTVRELRNWLPRKGANCQVFPAVIPLGSKIYVGTSGSGFRDIVSTDMYVFEDMEKLKEKFPDIKHSDYDDVWESVHPPAKLVCPITIRPGFVKL